MFLFFLYFSFAVIRNAAFSGVVAFWWVLASLLVEVVGRLMGTSLLLRFLRPMFLLLLRFGSSPVYPVRGVGRTIRRASPHLLF
jgi:hypothetical protein